MGFGVGLFSAGRRCHRRLSGGKKYGKKGTYASNQQSPTYTDVLTYESIEEKGRSHTYVGGNRKQGEKGEGGRPVGKTPHFWEKYILRPRKKKKSY